MNADASARPPADSWVAAVHASEKDPKPIGTAVVIDVDRVLTCAHLVRRGEVTRDSLWVAFPKAGNCPLRRVASVEVPDTPQIDDLAVLVLQEPVPPGVKAAPLRRPEPTDLIGGGWWAFGFPDAWGDSADGQVGEALAYGWVRLDTSARSSVKEGFSGGGLWSRDYQAVVGVVGQGDSNGNGRAVTLYRANQAFRGHGLAALTSWTAESAGMVALEQWGWTLAGDPEGVRHWQPRARGVGIESERGYRFRGRTAALSRIVQWLDRPKPDRRVLVVTGSPGVGKSAVLGRIVTTADADIRALLPASDEAVRASLGSVSCAVHAKAKTALEVAEEIARAASAGLPGEAGDLASAVRKALADRDGASFNVIIDALDEAASPAQARAMIDKVVLPLAETCADAGAQVIVGTRRRDGDGDLLGRFGGALAAIDLDDPQYFEEQDLAAYALACLQLPDDERPGSPYAADAVAEPLACAIAAMSDRNFLVAGLIARSHGLYDEAAADPERLAFPATVDAALADYLQYLAPVGELPATSALTALAFAEAPGLPVSLWQVAAEAIGGTSVSAAELTRFARSSAANFLVEAGDAVGTGQGMNAVRVYRLFHQALNDALLRARSDVVLRTDDEQALTRAFARHGRLSRWEEAPAYLLRSLSGHASAAGLVDDLLCDDAYLLHADLRRLMQVSEDATSAYGRGRVRLLRLTPEAISAGPGDRVALFSVTEALEDLGASYCHEDWESRYHARWASVQPRSERAPLYGHQDEVTAVCPVTVAGQGLLASASHDGAVRIWDPGTSEPRGVIDGHGGWLLGICPVTVGGRTLLAGAAADFTVRMWDPETGEQRARLKGHRSWVRAVCPVTVDGRELLASASDDGMVRIWDPSTGGEHAALEGHRTAVRAVCAVTVGGRELLASGGGDGTVRIWNPETGRHRAALEGHKGGVHGVCAVTVGGRELLASGGADGTVRIWDPETGQPRAVVEGHQGEVRAACPVTVGVRELLASAGADGTVRIWDPGTGQQRAPLKGHRGRVLGVCATRVDGRELLASAGDDGMVRIWDSRTGEQRGMLTGHKGGVHGICAVTVGGRELLASGGGDGTVRTWDPETGQQRAVLEGHRGGVRAVCPVTVGGQTLLVSAGADQRVRIWNPETGGQHAPLPGGDWVMAVCPVTVGGRALLASASAYRTVRIWDLETRKQLAQMKGHQGWVRAVCPVTVGGRALLASGGDDGIVRIWLPEAGQQHAILEGHQGWVWALCPLTVGGRELIASASADRTVRIWDPAARKCLLSVPTYHPALAVAWATESLAVGLDAGILVIKLDSAL
jgi:WD40 repeat protein